MQDPVTKEFIPQSPDYLLRVPGHELVSEFLRLCDREDATEVVYLNAQRWGSAMPCHRELARDASSASRKELSGVAYDVGRRPLAPTSRRMQEDSIVYDDSLGLLCAGDMVSAYTPGFEGAVLSALEAVLHLRERMAL